jgi:Ca-activated chloride channel homolog
VLAFNEAVRHVWGPSIAGHTDLGQFASAMSQAVVARGMTAIYDGLLAGLQRLRHGAHARQVLIVVSDGGDNASTATRDRVVAEVQESDATIYTVILTDPLIRGGNPRLLRRLASATGGEAFQPRRAADLSDAFARITDDIRHAYTLAYTPRRAAGAEAVQGRHRRVRVYVRMTDGRSVRVRTRDGYIERGSGTR